jgi:hypothetical protein
MMACLHILKSQPPEEFDPERPLKDLAYFAARGDCISSLGTPGGAPMNWNKKSAADTGAQAWAYHYYVIISTSLCLLCACCTEAASCCCRVPVMFFLNCRNIAFLGVTCRVVT